MAKGFIGKDEHLTEEDKALLRATRHLATGDEMVGIGLSNMGEMSGGGGDPVMPDDPQFDGTRTRGRLGKALSKLQRLHYSAATHIAEKEAERVKKEIERVQERDKPDGTVLDILKMRDRALQEHESGEVDRRRD